MKSTATLQRQRHRLSDPREQIGVLNSPEAGDIPLFRDKLAASGCGPLTPFAPGILQVNVGKMCNQTCAHCHVDAGPDRTEIMTRETMTVCLDVLSGGDFHTLDLTGGAPEMNEHFRWFVEKARPLVENLIVRSNLTIITANPRFHDLPQFFRRHRVEVVSSLPFYSRSRTDAQRGEGVFDASIEAIRRLNAEGYGQEGSGLELHLVYNPTGRYLPGDQDALEAEYKRRLSAGFGLTFNRLFTITNMPISRFLDYLIARGGLDEYMELLVDAWNAAAAGSVMCRNTLSVGWDGRLFDCDFNQMLDLECEAVTHITDYDADRLADRSIRTDQHCYGCTAGAGSSCGGALD